MLKFDFSVYPFQSCIFVWSRGNKLIFVLLYVDDLLIVGNCMVSIQKFKEHLKRYFEMKDLGFPAKFVGLEIEKCGKTLYLHQKRLINKVLEKVGMSHCKPVSTPMVTGPEKLNLRNDTRVKDFPYREVIGSLLYIAIGSRPDIAFSVNLLSRRQSNFTVTDVEKLKRILRYLNGSMDLCIKLEGKKNDLVCYVDSSLGADAEGGSTCGWLICLFGDFISWQAKRQRHVALSSAEAEYVAMSWATKEIISVRELIRRLLGIDLLPVLYEDNMTALRWANSDEVSNLKHIVNLCFHFVKLEVANGNVKVVWISTKDQLADGLTKALGKQQSISFQNAILTPKISKS